MTTSHPRRLLPALIASTALALAGCGSDDGGSTDAGPVDSITVLASFYPIAFVAEQVAGPDAQVDNLTQPGVDAHDLELTGQQVGRIAEADLVIYLHGFQPAVDEAVAQNAPDQALDVAELLTLIDDDGHAHGHDEDEDAHDEDGHAHDEDEHAHNEDEDAHNEDEDAHDEDEDAHDEDGHAHDEDGHAHNEDEHAHNEDEDAHDEDGHAHDEDEHAHGDLDGDPHVWQDPTNMAAIAEAVADRLSELAPDRADAFHERAHDLQDELNELDEEYRTGLAQCGLRTFVTSHAAFGYLAARYDLTMVGIAGIDPDSEPSPARIADVQRVVEDANITTIFYERLVSPAVAQSMAGDLGVETGVLDPIEGLTDETADEDYFSLMRANLDALREANGCS